MSCSVMNAQTYRMCNSTGVLNDICTGTFTDEGGLNGNYVSGRNCTLTFCAPAGKYLAFVFKDFLLENSVDSLIVFDGNSVASPRIGGYSGFKSPFNIFSSQGGCITFLFKSNNSIVFRGWEAAISCFDSYPVNDEPCNAIDLPVGNTCSPVTFANDWATASPGVPAPGCGNYSGADIWFKATVPPSGVLSVSTSPAGAAQGFLDNPAIAIYSGSCGNLSLISCNGMVNLNNNYFPAITRDGLVPGSVIYIRVWDEGGNDFGKFNICANTIDPPPCKVNPQAGDGCQTAAPICNLSGYCGSTSSAYAINAWPALDAAFQSCLPGALINNDSYLTFVAASTSATFNIYVTSSKRGEGIQMLFFEGVCGSNNITCRGSFDRIRPGVVTPVTAAPLIPGNSYFLLIDGWDGDDCNYRISAVSGVDILSATTSAARICKGDSTTLSVTGGDGVFYRWSPSSGLSSISGNIIKASPDTTTTYTVKSLGTGPCPDTILTTIVVTVDSLPDTPVVAPVSYCVGASSVPLSAVGNNLLWYDQATGGTGNIVAPTPSTATAGIFTFWVSQSSNNCESKRVPIVVSIGNSSNPPALACYQTAAFNSASCQWIVSGVQPVKPALACYQSATFNNTTCQWDVSGTLPTLPALACYQSAVFNAAACQWDISGTQPAKPSLACYQNAVFNNTTCQWDVTGSQPLQPTIACYQTTLFNNTTCQWDVSGSMPPQPVLSCNQSAIFNNTTCQWDVSGSPLQPVNETIEVCSASLPYSWHNKLLSAAGNYIDTLISQQGCDSIINLEFKVKLTPPAPQVTPVIDYCQYNPSSPLSATAAGQLVWYNLSMGGTSTAMPPVPGTDTSGSFYFYVSQIVNNCESERAIITVRINPKPELGSPKSIFLCSDVVYDLASAYPGQSGGIWSINGQTVANPGQITAAGSYRFIAINQFGCKDTGFVNLDFRNAQVVYAGPDDSVKYGMPYQLNGSGVGVNFSWTPGSVLNNPNILNPVAVITNDTWFKLTVTDTYGCKASDSAFIKVIFPSEFFVPTAFTPNGDGLNDLFGPYPWAGVANLEYFRVFNRFGQMIFETRRTGRGWDGKFNNVPQVQGNYTWMLKGTSRNGVIKVMKGNVMLIR